MTSLAVSLNQPKFSPCATWSPNATTFANINTVGYPGGLFINNNNTVFVASFDLNHVIVWLEGITAPTRVISGGLNYPDSIFVTNNGDIYVDNGFINQQVDKWMVNATSSVKVMDITSECYDMFIDLNSTLYCSLDREHKVVKMSLDDSSKTVTIAAGTGTSGAGPYMFNKPAGILVDIKLNLYVADALNNRIQFFQAGQLNGSTISTAPYTIGRPNDMAFDADGYLFIIDRAGVRIIGSGSLGFRCIVGCTGVVGSASNQLDFPWQLSFDSYGNLFVADYNNARVQKFFLATNACGKYDLLCTLTSSLLVSVNLSMRNVYKYRCILE